MTGATVYTETLIHAAPAAWADQAPYQIAIVGLPDGTRRTVRIEGEHVRIGDHVQFAAERDGAVFFRKGKPK
jgi:uncharacterized OB-fold protein